MTAAHFFICPFIQCCYNTQLTVLFIGVTILASIIVMAMIHKAFPLPTHLPLSNSSSQNSHLKLPRTAQFTLNGAILNPFFLPNSSFSSAPSLITSQQCVG